MKRVLLLLTASLLTISCSKTDAESITLKSDDEKSFYAIGYNWGVKLKSLNINPREFQALIKGASASVKNEKAEIDIPTYAEKIGAMAQSRAENSSKTEKKNLFL